MDALLGGKDMNHELKVVTANTAVGAGGMAVATLTLNDWVALATLTYMVLSSLFLLYKFYIVHKNGKIEE